MFGLMQTIPLPALTELAVWSGYDFVILDCEHGVVDEPAQIACLQVLSATNTLSAVRVKPRDWPSVGRYLDFGASGIVMPDVQTAEDAAVFVASANYGPNGTRSSTRATRALRYGLKAAVAAPPLLLATIEGARGAANVEAIAATPGLGGLVIGPSDLSADLGCPYDFAADAYVKAFNHIEPAAAKVQLLIGTIAHPGFPMERLITGGHRFLIVSADIAIIREGYESKLAQARGNLVKHGGQ
jgi:2-keto-3-deoxy-L-rhamnonate aldolase RhmA